MDANMIGQRDREFVERLREISLVPTYGEPRRHGYTTWRWHVDDRDDRYVEVTGSVRSGDYLLVRRDGEDAAAYVFLTVSVLVAAVRSQVDLLAARRKS